MAIDNTPPKLKLIATIGIIVVVTLVGLDFVFRGYLAYMSDMAVREKLAAPKDLEAQLAAEKAAFAKAKLPLDKAMADVAKGVRDPSIAPQQSDDLGPMTGWTKLPKPAPTAPQAAAPQVAPAGDAGVEPTGASDAGVPTVAAGPDAGAPKPAAASDAGAVVPDAGHGGH